MKNKLQRIVYAVIVLILGVLPGVNLSGEDIDVEDTKQIYKNKILENPLDPAIYKDYALFLMEVREFPNAIGQWSKHLAALLDRDIVAIMTDLEKYMADLETVEKIEDYIELVKKNKRVPEPEKQRLLKEARDKVKELASKEELRGRLDSLSGLMENKLHDAQKDIKKLPSQRIVQLAEIYYEIGLCCFYESYQGCLDWNCDREEFISKGIENLEKAIALNPADPEAYRVMALMMKEKIKVNPLKIETYKKQYKQWMKRHESVKKQAAK